VLYAVEVIPATKWDISMLNDVIDKAVLRIFCCASTDDIKYVRSVLLLTCHVCHFTSVVDFRNFRRQFAERFSWSTIVLNYVT